MFDKIRYIIKPSDKISMTDCFHSNNDFLQTVLKIAKNGNASATMLKLQQLPPLLPHFGRNKSFSFASLIRAKGKIIAGGSFSQKVSLYETRDPERDSTCDSTSTSRSEERPLGVGLPSKTTTNMNPSPTRSAGYSKRRPSRLFERETHETREFEAAAFTQTRSLTTLQRPLKSVTSNFQM